MRQRPPFVLHTSELAGGGRPRRAFPGKMELRWVAWYVVRTVGGGGGGRCTEEARDTRHARDGGGGRGGGQKAREQTPCSLSTIPSLPSARLDTRLDPLFTARVLFGRICRKESATNGQMCGLDRNFMHTRNKSAGTCTPKKAVLQLALHFSSIRKSEGEY